MSIEFFKEEMDRAFRVLGIDKGFDQNLIDIQAWRDEGRITNIEYKEFLLYNKTRYQDLFLKMF